MKDINTIFIELIHVALGIKRTLSRTPSAEEWTALYLLAKKQTLIGICFAAIRDLANNNNPVIQNLDKALYLKWFSKAVGIQKINELNNKRCFQIQKRLRLDGLESCILKGQGIARFYRDDLRLLRQSGDIDVWVNGDWRTVMDYVASRTPNREFDTKHARLDAFSDIEVEMHWAPFSPIDTSFSKALHQYYEEQKPIQCKHTVLLPDTKHKITAPDAKFEAIHAISHIFNHFLYEGIGLRQMMDLYFVLVASGMDKDERDEVANTIKRTGLSKFASATMWVLEQVFAMDKSYAICPSNPILGKQLLDDIEDGGNFGYEKENGQVHHKNFCRRMVGRYIRRIHLAGYNPKGLLYSPFNKIKMVMWKHFVIRKYKL